jgi:hypothetical protein
MCCATCRPTGNSRPSRPIVNGTYRAGILIPRTAGYGRVEPVK